MAPKIGGKGGGIRQKLGLVRASPKQKPAPSELGDQLKALYRKGKISAVDVGDTAAASSSGASAAPADIVRFAKAKAKINPSRNPSKHSSRSLRRSLGKAGNVRPLRPRQAYIAKIPLWNEATISAEQADLAFLPIHETLGELATAEDAAKWTDFSDDQSGFRHDLHQWGDRVGLNTKKGHWATIGLWGDSAPTVNEDSVFLLSFCLLAGVVRQRFWICALNKSRLCKCGCKGRHTIDSLFAVVAWSVRALIAGEYPARDHLGGKFASHSPRGKLAGKPLPMRGAVLRKFGDWAWFKQALGLRGHQGEGEKGLVCWLCRAGRRDPVNYCWNFEEGAAWRSTGTSMRDFWEEQQ